MYMCVWVFVRLFLCLLIRVSLCFLGWLVVWVYGLCVLVCFSALAAHFRGLLALFEVFCVFLALWGALELHCNTWGSTLPPLLDNFAGFL